VFDFTKKAHTMDLAAAKCGKPTFDGAASGRRLEDRQAAQQEYGKTMLALVFPSILTAPFFNKHALSC
jgi:hypothetical protein